MERLGKGRGMERLGGESRLGRGDGEVGKGILVRQGRWRLADFKGLFALFIVTY